MKKEAVNEVKKGKPFNIGNKKKAVACRHA